MTAVAVVAHSRKSLDGGLAELRKTLAERGVVDPLWLEVDKSSKAPRQVERALDKGAELIFSWGGDGMVQRCVDWPLLRERADGAVPRDRVVLDAPRRPPRLFSHPRA